MQRVLVIGDAHVDEHQSLTRFTALGTKIEIERPDVVLIIGDFMSMNCLSDWDRNKRKKMEGLRYHKEIAAGNDALDRMLNGLNYNPRLVYVKGNHENRLDRYLDVDPTFAGHVSIETDLKLKARGFEVVEYKGVFLLAGVSFTHIPANGIGKPIGNPNVAKKALALFSGSVVFGHTHTLDHCAEHRHGAPHLNQALSVGCFFEHIEDYAKGSKTDYWRGIVDLEIYHNNRFDICTTSMSQLYNKYGSTPKNKKKRSARRAAA